MCGYEGGGSGGSGIETIGRSTSGSHLDAREVVVVARRVETPERSTPARIRVRWRVEVVEAALKPLKSPPPALIWTRERWKKGGGVVGVSGVIVVSHCRFILVMRLATSV